MPPDDARAADTPTVLCNTADVLAAPAPADAGGALWKLDVPARQLDSNVVRLRAGGHIERHVGPELDVLMHVLAGSGELSTDADGLALATGTLVWLPRRSARAITAGPDGLVYLTVHPRRPALSIGAAPSR